MFCCVKKARSKKLSDKTQLKKRLDKFYLAAFLSVVRCLLFIERYDAVLVLIA